MSITIQNISEPDAPVEGTNQYQLRINGKIICEFEHNRTHDGLAQCLRDAANKVEECEHMQMDGPRRYLDHLWRSDHDKK